MDSKLELLQTLEILARDYASNTTSASRAVEKCVKINRQLFRDYCEYEELKQQERFNFELVVKNLFMSEKNEETLIMEFIAYLHDKFDYSLNRDEISYVTQ